MADQAVATNTDDDVPTEKKLDDLMSDPHVNLAYWSFSSKSRKRWSPGRRRKSAAFAT